MRLHRRRPGFILRPLPVVALIVAGTLIGVLVLLLPDLEWVLPSFLRHRRTSMVLVGLAIAYALGRAWVYRKGSLNRSNDRPAWLLDRVDALAAVALSRGLTIIAAALCVAFLATWLPHYLLWPWTRDADTFATLALSWDHGILPYRDIRGYNFPGAIYLSWLLGKTFGWGRTWPWYAFDATVLLLLGALLTTWSRRCLGQVLPGLIAYVVFLVFYLSCSFEWVAQRDWQTSLCAVLGLLCLEAWPGRATRLLSALLAAVALIVRPHAIFFLPALAAGVLDDGERSLAVTRPAGAWRLRRLAAWACALAAFTAMLAAPLLIAGIADDLVRGLKVVAYGGPYNHATRASVVHVLADELQEPATVMILGLLALLLVCARGPQRRRVVTWTLAFVGALAYRLFHPVQHYYLIHPVALFGPVVLALPIAWIVGLVRVPPPLRVLALLLVLSEMKVRTPTYCNPRAALDAIVTMARGQTLPTECPPGGWSWFARQSIRAFYKWEDYRSALIYLRETTQPNTMVANVLQQPLYPAINGPTGRLSPFRAESGICWMVLVDIDLEPEFAAALEQATDLVVVWSPEDYERGGQLQLERLGAVIREQYRPEARFGRIEVWRRADAVR
jgi:hypothetical protein